MPDLYSETLDKLEKNVSSMGLVSPTSYRTYSTPKPQKPNSVNQMFESAKSFVYLHPNSLYILGSVIVYIVLYLKGVFTKKIGNVKSYRYIYAAAYLIAVGAGYYYLFQK